MTSIQSSNYHYNNCICKVKCNNGKYINGFLCVIPFINIHNILPVLIIYNNIVDNKELKDGKKIYFNKEKTIYEIIIDSSRKTFTDKKYNITFIEILEKDKINIDSFLYFDEDIFTSLNNFQNRAIYLIYYGQNQNLEYANGKIEVIDEENYNIEFICDNQLTETGCPILSLNNKIIGIYKSQNHQNSNIYNGLLLKEPIEMFFNIEFNKTFDNLNCDLFDSVSESLNEENIVPIIPKFHSALNIIDYNNDKNNYFLNELKNIMEQHNISYSFLNYLNEPLFKAIQNAKKKDLIKLINSQLNTILPRVLVNSKKKNILNNIKFYRNAYEKEAKNINTIINSINQLNTNLLIPLEIIKEYFINEENNHNKNIEKKREQEPYLQEPKRIKKPFRKDMIFWYKNKIENTILSNNIYFFFNSFKELTDLTIRIKDEIVEAFIFFQNSIKEFEDIENKEKINNGFNSIKNALFKIIMKLIDKKKIKFKVNDRNNNLEVEETIQSICEQFIEKAKIIKENVQSEKLKINLNKINLQNIEKNIIQIQEKVELIVNNSVEIIKQSEELI